MSKKKTLIFARTFYCNTFVKNRIIQRTTRMKKVMIASAMLLGAWTGVAQHVKIGEAKKVVASMSLEEKVNLVVGMGMPSLGMGVGGTGVGQITEGVPGAAGSTFSIPKLGINTTLVADGPAGLRIDPTRKDDKKTYYATAWPVATLLASTWDTDLVKNVGKAMGNEVKEYGVDVLLAPGMNIQRNPLGGRNFEYYSEDPIVTGKIAAAMVNGIQSNGVGTSIKHFAVNNQERNRNSVNAIVSERALREIYLKGFQIAVKESNPWTVMSSYNRLNGSFTSENPELLNTVLRKEWGFKGMVMTDWFGGRDAVAQMKAGNDLLMPGTDQQRAAIIEAVKSGKLDVKIVDANAERIVNYILISPSQHKYKFSNTPDLKAHAALARQAASEGMVLLTNKNKALPINNVKNIAAFGITSYDFVSGGRGSGDVNEEYTISLVDGLKNAGYALEEKLTGLYVNYVSSEKAKQPKKSFFEEFMNPTPRISEMELSTELLSEEAQKAEVALVTIGRNAGEGADRAVTDDFNLTAKEVELINKVSEAFHAQNKKVIVVINAGGVIETASWKDKVDAILLSWQPGLEAGNAVADVLSGKVNPSGKLAATFPAKYEDDVTAKNFPGVEFKDKIESEFLGMKTYSAEVVYEEGVYVGYRYYNTFNVPVSFPFGYGLSYTNFAYSNLKLSSTSLKDKIVVTVDIMNAGSVAGKEVVQLYIHAPKGQLDKPSAELKAFAKTKTLAPGEKQSISFEIKASDLASFDTEKSAWIAEAGQYNVMISASSTDVKQQQSFTVKTNIVTEKCNKVLAPKVAISELKAK